MFGSCVTAVAGTLKNKSQDKCDASDEPITTETENLCDEGYTVLVDEGTIYAIIRVQALIRGFLTRKLIYEHLQ